MCDSSQGEGGTKRDLHWNLNVALTFELGFAESLIQGK